MPDPGRSYCSRWGALAVVAAALLAGGTVACNQGQLVLPNPVPAPPAAPTALASYPQGVQQMSVEVDDGRFSADHYDAQTGEIRMHVTTQGGPYTLSIDPLVAPQSLPADQKADVDFTVPDPGTYTMTLKDASGTTEDTAVLNVRRPGF